jgi:hypothetical protein
MVKVMRRWFWGIFLVTSAVGMGTGYYVLFSPKIGTATAAQIDALLPASLKARDAPDPQGEERYNEVASLAHLLNEKPLGRFANPPEPLVDQALPENETVLAKIEAVLKQGALRVPVRTRTELLPELPKLKNVAKLIGVSIQAAQKRGDARACERWAGLSIRYSEAIGRAGGTVIDQLVATSIDAISLRSIYLAEIENGFDGQGRARLIGMLKPRDGTSPEMADAVRRDFQTYWMPFLYESAANAKELMEIQEPTSDLRPDDEPEPARSSKPLGTFDPIASAKLAGGIYDAMISDLGRAPTKVLHAEKPLVDEAEKGLPTTDSNSGLEGLWYRVRMNVGNNTLGRKAVASSAIIELTHAVGREATNRNLIRAVLMLRSGVTPSVIDPYGKGNLYFDRKQQIVWSVGKDGRNDGGMIDKGYVDGAPDLGYPYGDHSWAKLHPPDTSRSPFPSGPPLGFPPPSVK